jgi:hypothetical protein
MTIYWASANRPPLGSMVATAMLTDGMPGDTASGIADGRTVSAGASCTLLSASAQLTVVADLGCLSTLTGVSLTWNRTRTKVLTGPNLDCDPEYATASSDAVALEYSTDFSTWTSIPWSGSVSPPQTLMASPSVTARYVRAYLASTYEEYISGHQIGVSLTATDFRITATINTPSAPTLTGPAVCEGPQNTITWTSVSCADGYEIQLDGAAIVDVGVATSYTHTGLIVPSTHTYRVRAYNSAGSGPWSTLLTGVSTCVVAAAPLPPTVRALSGCFGEEVRLYLEASSGAVEWRIYRIDATGDFPVSPWLTTRPTATSPFVDSPRPIGQAATYYALARNSIGTSAASAGVSIAACLPGCECTEWTLERCL